MRRFAIAVVVLLVLLVALVWIAGRGTFGSPEEPGQITSSRRPDAVLAKTRENQVAAGFEVGVARPKQILFGDLHVHTTYSRDAFLFSLPMLGGEGAHPPSDACDFARFCSALDFWSINDHASNISADEWKQTVDGIRQCNLVGGEGSNPDTVAFLGWEWTQVGLTPETHYGHKNVILASTEEGEVPPRAIASVRQLGTGPPTLGLGIGALMGGGRMHDLAAMFAASNAREACPDDVPTTELPADCMEVAPTPADLFRKLDEGGTEAIVIPHGTTWGLYSPPGSSWDKQLVGPMHDDEKQILFEVYSGHGEAEVYRDWRAVEIGEDGSLSCPEPSDDYLPTCWHAGELIRKGCLAAGEDASECEARAVVARQNAVEARVAVHRTVPGSGGADWLDAGQCLDCDEPSFNYRPASSAQYVAALGNFDEAGEPRRFRMGFMASSDNHFARPGTGYKEQFRSGFTESLAGASLDVAALPISPWSEADALPAESVPFNLEQLGFNVFETERQGSFFVTGGLIAAHADGRDRDSIWSSMQRREVYGTSGPRMLLWFDLLNQPGASLGRTLPMGGDVEMDGEPIFQARAVGSFEQLPGCPDFTTQALTPDRLAHLCKGECYHPSERRRLITRIEVIRIRPQNRPNEPVGELVDDPWKTFACEPDPAGCSVTFADPEYQEMGRDTLYYVRAYETPAPAINADNVRCERDSEGKCLKVDLCPSADGSNPDCLAEHEPRAWSSPIYLDHPAAR
ncbi:MAG: DUF3604 domain-containing protein, partial [Myxococcota bacterium]